ncbi:hypothetical protein PtA15_18A177 [Puccinia triticina]|uniref:P-loop containing nucleoside triphosphate hydrolase protein n=1 Tax=Puccinia triticina TaxID=208348 RepID=A0ABY7D637_9BASI|nr:uncharacterized protein PtA15_18A177 [Puccinia triticina]WAQ93119.1 hypothetical protein PtA15_18A177 [Puccinia triticina]
MARLKTAKEILVQFILNKLRSHPARVTETGAHKPVVLGIQGPQGIGKTWLSREVKEELNTVHHIKTIALSLDDLYLPRRGQEKVEEQEEPRNRLLQGRGLPGTHDLDLAVQVFKSLSRINETKEILLPVYDKSALDGLGDRTGFATLSVPPDEELQLVIFEGWMLGFAPRDPLELRRTYDHAREAPSDTFITKFSIDELLKINLNLSAYLRLIWPRIDVLINLVPQDINFIWRWRIQQENEMKAKNGGIGMSEEEVKKFIFRYIPCYELYGQSADDPNSKGIVPASLKVVMDEERRVVDVYPKDIITDAEIMSSGSQAS